MIDIFIGKRNEELEKQTKKLGFSEVFFAKIIENEEDFNELKKTKDKPSKSYDVCLIKIENLARLQGFIDKASNYFSKIIVLGASDKANRIVLEHKRTWALFDPQYAHKDDKDYSSYRNSGLNHILCKIAEENEKVILFSLNELENPLVLGRVIQNIKLCRKYKTKYAIVNLSSAIEKCRSAFEIKEVERILLKEEHFEHAQKQKLVENEIMK